MKNTFLKWVLGIILVASFIGVFFVMSIMDLVNTKDVYEVSIDEAVELLTVEKSINGIIPTGKEYFYLGLNEDSGKLYAIHADKKWLKNNFDSNGMSNGNAIIIKGLSKRASDFQVEKEIESRVGQVVVGSNNELVSALASGYVLELNYVLDSIVRLIAGILILAFGILIFACRNRREEFPAWAQKGVVVLLVATLVFALWAIL